MAHFRHWEQRKNLWYGRTSWRKKKLIANFATWHTSNIGRTKFVWLVQTKRNQNLEIASSLNKIIRSSDPTNMRSIWLLKREHLGHFEKYKVVNKENGVMWLWARRIPTKKKTKWVGERTREFSLRKKRHHSGKKRTNK